MNPCFAIANVSRETVRSGLRRREYEFRSELESGNPLPAVGEPMPSDRNSRAEASEDRTSRKTARPREVSHIVVRFPHVREARRNRLCISITNVSRETRIRSRKGELQDGGRDV